MTDFASREGVDGTDAAQTDRRALLLGLTSVLLLGFVLRCFMWGHVSIVNGDGVFYIWRAQKLMAGDLWNGVSAYWSPLYSFLTGLIGYPLQDFESGGRVVSLLAGTLLILATFYLGALLYDKTTGVIAGLLVALHAPMIQAAAWVMTEALYGLLFLGMITTGWLALQRNSVWHWALTGLLTGLAYLTKPEALGFICLFFLFTLVAVVADRVNARKLSLGFVVMTFVVAACVVPYVVFLHAKVGVWTVSKKTSTNTMSGVDEDRQLTLTSDGKQTIMDQLWGDEYLEPTGPAVPSVNEGSSPTLPTKLGWAYGLFRRQIDDFLPALLSVAFVPLIVVGLFSSPWTRTEATRHLYLGAFVLATLVGYSFAVTNIRYLLAIIPLLLIWTAYGSMVFAAWLSATVTKISSGSINVPSSLSRAVVIVGLIVLSTPSILAKFDQQDITGIPLEEKRAGLWLRSHGADGSATVMASHATVAYYAGANHLFLPDEDLGTIIDYAKRRKVDFIVLSSRRSGPHKRSLTAVSAESAQDLELVHSDLEGGEEYSIRIYKVRL